MQWQLGAFGQDLPKWVVMLGRYFISHSTLSILKPFSEKSYTALGVCDTSPLPDMSKMTLQRQPSARLSIGLHIPK